MILTTFKTFTKRTIPLHQVEWGVSPAILGLLNQYAWALLALASFPDTRVRLRALRPLSSPPVHRLLPKKSPISNVAPAEALKSSTDIPTE
jgi:hypothetical protein